MLILRLVQTQFTHLGSPLGSFSSIFLTILKNLPSWFTLLKGKSCRLLKPSWVACSKLTRSGIKTFKFLLSNGNLKSKSRSTSFKIINSYSPKWGWIGVDINRTAKRRWKYSPFSPTLRWKSNKQISKNYFISLKYTEIKLLTRGFVWSFAWRGIELAIYFRISQSSHAKSTIQLCGIQ